MASVAQVWGDVFAMPTALGHAVSRDFHMGAGIATGFREYFGGVEELRSQGKRVGEVAHLLHNDTHIFYLITKECYRDKSINMSDVVSCLYNLEALCVSLNVPVVSIPRIGCGMDSLRWADVLPHILTVFNGSRVSVNVVTPPPHFREMAVLGDSQGLRFLLSRGSCPREIKKVPFPSSVGFCTSGIRLEDLLETLSPLPNNALNDVLVFIGTNNLLDLCSMDSNKRGLKRQLRGFCCKLRTLLSNKCKACCRAVVLTVPPLPKLLLPHNGENHHYWSTFNRGLLELSCPRFHVLDVESLFMRDGVIAEDMFESVMGRGSRQREDRLHINEKGMSAIVGAIESLPPFAS